MCIESKSCLCHRIKDSIIADEKAFLGLFKQRKMIELYSFLKDSYRVINPKSNSKKFDTRLQSIVLTYLKPNDDDAQNLVINVNDEELKKKFLHTYEKYQNHQRDKAKILYRLERLVHDVEKLAYNNLEENADFMAYLQPEPEKETKKLRRSLSLKLPRFLHKKSPSSDKQAQESQAESSSSSSPSSSN